MKMYNTTEDDFKYFIACCEEFIALFGMSEWSVFYSHADIDGMGQADCDVAGMVATISLSKKWLHKPARKQVRKTAAHEVLEVLLSRIGIYSLNLKIDRNTKRDLVYSETHMVIRKIEKILASIDLEDRII